MQLGYLLASSRDSDLDRGLEVGHAMTPARTAANPAMRGSSVRVMFSTSLSVAVLQLM
jgi:hypothetical protein